MKVAVVKETAPGERRVALVPDAVTKLQAAGLEVLVESGAGDGAWLADDAFTEAGASVVSREEALQAGLPERAVALRVVKGGPGVLHVLRITITPGG